MPARMAQVGVEGLADARFRPKAPRRYRGFRPHAAIPTDTRARLPQASVLRLRRRARASRWPRAGMAARARRWLRARLRVERTISPSGVGAVEVSL